MIIGVWIIKKVCFEFSGHGVFSYRYQGAKQNVSSQIRFLSANVMLSFFIRASISLESVSFQLRNVAICVLYLVTVLQKKTSLHLNDVFPDSSSRGGHSCLLLFIVLLVI